MKYFFFLLFVPFAVQAVELTYEQTKIANEIFAETMSPFCPGRLLQDCPSSAAAELKEKLRERIKSGESKEDLEGYLYGLYGEATRAAPRFSGFGIAAWLTPFLFLLCGFLFAVRWMKRDRSDSPVLSVPAIDPDVQKRIDSEL